MGYIGVITHLLTINPDFLGHPSTTPTDQPLQRSHTWRIMCTVSCKRPVTSSWLRSSHALINIGGLRGWTKILGNSLPETNNLTFSGPKNGWLEYFLWFPFGSWPIFRCFCLLVSCRVFFLLGESSWNKHRTLQKVRVMLGMEWNGYLLIGFLVALGIQSYSQMMIGVSNHLRSIVFRFHYHSQKVIGCLGLAESLIE